MKLKKLNKKSSPRTFEVTVSRRGNTLIEDFQMYADSEYQAADRVFDTFEFPANCDYLVK